MRAFISYSHHDKDALGRLHVHLRNLTRDGSIATWYDRDILAGSNIDANIDQELETADLFLLLISPDFIASDYCVEREMTRALQRHDAGDARVVPVILEECDWRAMKQLKKLKAIPTDGKAISTWANPNTAYLNVVQELRRIIASDETPKVETTSIDAVAAPRIETPRYRAKREFDQIDYGEFRDRAFSTVKEYFRRAVDEINLIDGLRGRFINHGSTTFGASVVNSGIRNSISHITVHSGGSNLGLYDISYTFQENAASNSANGGFNISSDDYELFLTGAVSTFAPTSQRVTPEHAAEALWNEFIGKAGIRYE